MWKIWKHKHDWQFRNTILTEKAKIVLHLCDGDSCNQYRIKTIQDTDSHYERIPIIEVRKKIIEYKRSMVETKLRYKFIENKRREWEDCTDLPTMEYCSNCGEKN